MRTTVVLTFICLVGAVHSACPPTACLGVRCAAVQCAGAGERLDAQGGVCGCCPACVRLLSVGESCRRMPGQYSTPTCAAGLRCDQTSFRCVTNQPVVQPNVPNPGPVNQVNQGVTTVTARQGEYCGPSFFVRQIACAQGLRCVQARCVQSGAANQVTAGITCEQMAANVYEAWRTRAQNNYGIFISWLQSYNTQPNAVPADLPPLPVCKDDGSYAPVQCLREGGTRRCYCASSQGILLREYPANSQTSTCLCAQAQADYRSTGLIGQSFSCEQDGSFRAVQCIGSVCYCSDMLGNKLTRYTAPISNIRALGCACARAEARSPFGSRQACDAFGNFANGP